MVCARERGGGGGERERGELGRAEWRPQYGSSGVRLVVCLSAAAELGLCERGCSAEPQTEVVVNPHVIG